LLKQAELIGVLYLENSLASHAFTPARIASARRTGGGLAGIDHELGVCQMGGGRALQQYTSTQKKSPTICGGQISSQNWG
jgi:hypothetical protein